MIPRLDNKVSHFDIVLQFKFHEEVNMMRHLELFEYIY
jgi:hypothetical protein